MDCILGMDFITNNNVFIEGHNRLIKIPSKNGVAWVKAYEMHSVGGSTIHLMLGKTLENKCMGGYGLLCVMRVLDEFEPKEATNLMNSPKCVKETKRKLNKNFLKIYTAHGFNMIQHVH
jgi:hypothetical protein